MMKKIIISAVAGSIGIAANAVMMLPSPEELNHVIGENSIELSWHNKSADRYSKPTHYHVIVYKVHTATEAETFVLAENDFSYIESVGTINKHEHRGGGWANVAGCPGWYVKSPKYMNGAIGIDTYFYYAGSDNDDYFGGAYMLSPHYDLSGLTDPTLTVEGNLAAEATSVTGGFCVYAWSTDFFEEGREHYVPLNGDRGHDHHYTDVSTTKFQNYTETCTIPDHRPEWYNDRIRVCFYGTGYSMFWVDDLKVSVNMQPGDRVRYAAGFAEIPAVAGDGINRYSIDITGDTDDDYVDGYQVRGVWIEPYTDIDTEDTNDYIRFVSPDLVPEVIVNKGSDINLLQTSDRDAKIQISGNEVIVESGDSQLEVEVYGIGGESILKTSANRPFTLSAKGVYLVKAGKTVMKVVI